MLPAHDLNSLRREIRLRTTLKKYLLVYQLASWFFFLLNIKGLRVPRGAFGIRIAFRFFLNTPRKIFFVIIIDFPPLEERLVKGEPTVLAQYDHLKKIVPISKGLVCTSA